jgi:hypothetical protein
LGSSWCALVQDALGKRLQEGQHELSLGGGGLLSSRIGLELAKELLAGRYLAGRCSLSANALGKSELYLLLLRTLGLLRLVVVDQRRHWEKPE